MNHEAERTRLNHFMLRLVGQLVEKFKFLPMDDKMLIEVREDMGEAMDVHGPFHVYPGVVLDDLTAKMEGSSVRIMLVLADFPYHVTPAEFEFQVTALGTFTTQHEGKEIEIRLYHSDTFGVVTVPDFHESPLCDAHAMAISEGRARYEWVTKASA